MNPVPSWDPLGYAADLPLEATFYPLGFALQIATNSERVLAAARLSWPRPNAAFPDPPLHLRIIVSDGDDSSLPAPSARAQGHLVTLVAGPNDFAACDAERGFAFAAVREATVSDSKHFRFYYLECLAYLLLSWHKLTPIHASCVSIDGNAVLFCGKPGSGKSCLAYACARSGFSFLSDDAVYLVRDNAGPSILGKPEWLRLKESAAELFPELQDHPPALDVDGEKVIELETARLDGVTTLESASQARVIFLDRQPGIASVRLDSVAPEEALQLVLRDLPRWDPQVTASQVDSIRRLVARGAHRLTYDDLTPAVEEVKRLVSRIRPAPI